MSMDSNFDDTMFDDDEFSESSTTQQEDTSSQETPQEENNEDDLTSEVLKLRGIDDPDKILFQDDSGAVVTRSWDSLSREEQINILGNVKEQQDQPNNELENDEINLINAIRNSGMDVNSYLQTLTPQVNQPQQTNVIDTMSDEDLYAFDILNKVGSDNITDEELDQALESAKTNEALFKKTVDGLRASYNRQYEEEQANIANQQQAAQQQKYQAFANAINNQIDVFDNFAGQEIQLSNEDKDNLSEFMTSLDENGISPLGYALQNPAILTKAAFWLLNEDSISAELQKQVQDAYTRGFNAGKGDMLNKSKLVFKPKTTSKKSDPTWDSDDWD